MIITMKKCELPVVFQFSSVMVGFVITAKEIIKSFVNFVELEEKHCCLTITMKSVFRLSRLVLSSLPMKC